VRGPFWRAALSFVFGNLGWKLLSLAVAVVLWIVVAGEPELLTVVRVPVQYRNLPDGLEINSAIPDSVDVELRGPSGQLASQDGRGHYVVVLDMSDVQSGQRTFSIGPSEVRVPRGIRFVQSIPAQLRFEFEPRAYRMAPVQVRFSPPPKGYDVAGFKVTPLELQIVGPQSRVGRINSVATDAVDLSAVVGQQEFHVNAYAEDPRVRFIRIPEVTVIVQVRARPTP
jgi:YbbR domain-containing protein